MTFTKQEVSFYPFFEIEHIKIDRKYDPLSSSYIYFQLFFVIFKKIIIAKNLRITTKYIFCRIFPIKTNTGMRLVSFVLPVPIHQQINNLVRKEIEFTAEAVTTSSLPQGVMAAMKYLELVSSFFDINFKIIKFYSGFVTGTFFFYFG